MNEHTAVMSKNILLEQDGKTRENTAPDTPQFSEKEIQTVLAGLWFLRFPPRLEKAYRAHALTQSIKTYRFNGLYALGVFAIICMAVYRLIPPESVTSTTHAYSCALAVMVGVRIFSLFRGLDQWFNWYVTTSSIVMTTIAVYANNAIPMGAGSTLSYIGLTYILFFIYCFVGLRLQLAMMANLIGGICGVLITYAMGSQMDWHIMPPTFATASFLAMFLAYGLGRQERINFLQSYLLKLSLEKSEKLSREDALTGLANRRYLNEMLVVEWNRMLRQKQALTIIMIDIDFFKRYNDALGHLAGDKCLHHVARLISEEAKRGGELAARYGGEEFVLLFPDMDLKSAQQQVERLIARINASAIPHPDSPLNIVTVSAGVSVCVPQPDMTVDQLLRQADDALYRAKANGKNRYEFL
jgi:diguanylate cyclase (GGDEF)-like protein